MKRESVLDKIIGYASVAYLKLIAKTSKIKFVPHGEIDREEIENCILGFWHGESYTMFLLLKQVMDGGESVKVVVTADRRGDYIQESCEAFGIKTLRMPDGIKMKSFLKELKEEAREEHSTTCIALDGPLGPLYEPKKVAFLLSNTSNKPFIGIKSTFSKKILLKKRWDNYVVPLPFGKIEFHGYKFGITENEQLRNFNTYKEEIKDVLKY